MADKPEGELPFLPPPWVFRLGPQGPTSVQLEQFRTRQVKAYQTLYRGYEKIHDKAEVGQAVSAKDFERAEGRFNRTMLELEGLVETEIQGMVAREMREEAQRRAKAAEQPVQPPDPKEMEQRVRQATGLYFLEMRERVNETVKPELFAKLRRTEPLLAALKQAQAEAGLRRPNTKVLDENGSEEELLIQQLGQNEGIAVCDFHARDKATRFIKRHAALMKEQGVDTLYIEFPDKAFRQFSELSLPQLRTLGERGQFGNFRLPTAQENAARYQVNVSDDVQRALVGMMVAIRENGIRIVNFDKKSPARDVEVGFSAAHRVASTNFTWPEAIARDREMLRRQGVPVGRYVAWAGMDHFLVGQNGEGLVDESLGIPVIAFARRGEGEEPAFQRGYVPGAPDFYLRGGADYFDTEKSVAAVNLKRLQAAVKRFESLPPAQIAQSVMGAAVQWLDESVHRSAMGERPKIGPIEVPPLPTPPLPLPVSQEKERTK